MYDNCFVFILIKEKKKHLYISGLKWHMLVQHEYPSLSDCDHNPVTSKGKITSNHKHCRI